MNKKSPEQLLADTMRKNSIKSLGKLTNTKVEYGFHYVYFNRSDKRIEYRHGKEILARRLLGM